jgi:hypothetical protein
LRLDRPLTAFICALIVVATWLAALAQHWNYIAVAGAIATTLLCAAVLLHYVRITVSYAIPERARRPAITDEAAQFRRGLFNLLAALKLGIRYCEDHLDAEPEQLIEQLEQMYDNIDSFINQTVRPVRFCERVRWRWRLYPRWPWRPNAQQGAGGRK